MEERRMEDKTRMIHKVYLNARKSAVLSGVRDVLSFDAKEVYLETEQGVLLIQGDELHVNRLSWRREKSILMGGSTVLLILTGRKLRKKQLLF